MRTTLFAALAVPFSALLLAGAAQAAEMDISHCKFPEPPVVPEGAEATETEMGEAGVAVREFVSGIQSSLECLTAVETSLGEEITEEQQAELVAVYNNGVDQMQSVAENYNAQVRAFKDR
ncbi:MAG: hypothetical protein U5Q16_02020 [Gammaproteobacteria bacterium]|nr:hypothetical protein [Gammaproteobacteria bacterium]